MVLFKTVQPCGTGNDISLEGYCNKHFDKCYELDEVSLHRLCLCIMDIDPECMTAKLEIDNLNTLDYFDYDFVLHTFKF